MLATSMLTIHFYLRYQTIVGQSFFITGNISELGNGDTANALPLSYLNDEFWYGSLEVDAAVTPSLTYNYLLQDTDGIMTTDWGTDRNIKTARAGGVDIQVIDAWNYAGEFQNALYTQPFQQTLFSGQGAPIAGQESFDDEYNITHIFKVKTPVLAPGQTLCIVGSASELSSWDTIHPRLLGKDGNWYTIALNLSQAAFPVAYKYGVWDISANGFVHFEDGKNRLLNGNGARQHLTVLHDGFANLPSNNFRGAGVAIPVFSLRSQKSFGVGEFTDIHQLVDWAKKAGLKLIQLLPLNDTTATHTLSDSYPYAAISAFALHPMFINLAQVAGEKHKAIMTPLSSKQATLNALPEVDYEQVTKIKNDTLKLLYAAMKASWQANEDWLAFYDYNRHWLLPYAVFCYLRDTNNTIEFANWGKYAIYNPAEIEKLASPKSKVYDKVAVHLFVQYQLHVQLSEAAAYAHQNDIVMKGDIPIGVYRNSCDAWVNPGLFNMDAQAGAPPDDFAIKGQNWGFPTYNWQQMQEDGFSWWKQRFEQMSHYFDAFRIDHILGFFRIWSIPMDAVQGILGRFAPAIPVFRSEFKDKGIWFDKDRYCKPFINDMVLRELFGIKAEWVKDNFVDNVKQEPYHLKEGFNSQRKLEAWFASQSQVDDWIRDKLYDLVSNVVLIEEPGSTDEKFHPRISMDKTSSFRYLDINTQLLLTELYSNYFFDRQNHFWKQQAMQKLPALKASTNMLICGEDLGMVPDCVPGVMKDLGILSLEIQRMPKDPKQQFFHPAQAPYMSVVTPSTHDMSTIRGWWEEDRIATQQFYNNELGHSGPAPYFCEAAITKDIIVQHLYSPAMWSIFQLQDLLGMDGELRRENPAEERINVPANPRHYWRYRMHIYLEDLVKADGFNKTLSEFAADSGR
ncbi:MAG: 4-alpha-glucanotransferase [Chitinophagaceae bacterium]